VKVVGLTGGIATGKSTVGRLFRAWGAEVLDADQVAREVVAPGTEGFGEVVAAFGSGVVGPDGGLDRAALRTRIAADAEARRRLEGITHPRILRTIAERLAALAAAGRPLAVVEAALMVETGSYRMYPAVVVVTTTPELQLARLLARDGTSEADARRLIAAQLPLHEKERVATHLVRNDGTEAELEARARAVFEAISA
jgi:dephospho-CoA kinase